MGRGQELLDAARKGDVRTVTKIIALITKRSGPFTSLRRGAGINVQDDNGYTPLHHACMNGHREIVHLLLSVEASPCVVDKKGATPLHLAAFKGDSHVVAMLLSHCNPPVNIDQKTNDEETALLIAAQFGFVDVVAQLIAKGADVALKNNKDESPLDLAAQYGKLDTVAQLINAKPQLIEPYRSPLRHGRCFTTTPLHRATMNGHEEVVEYLLDAGVDPNILTENGTALHEGVRYLRDSAIRVLLNKGADLNAVDRKGNTAIALLCGYPKEATKRVRSVIKKFEEQMKIAYESEEDLPRIPVNDYPSPVGGYVNSFGMIRVLPKLGTNSDASTNSSVKKRVFNSSHSLSKKNSLPPHKFTRAFSSRTVRSERYTLTKEVLPSKRDSLDVQPSYVNYEDLMSEETEATAEPTNNGIYGNISYALKQQSDCNTGSKNSAKWKPTPPPKPMNQTQQPAIHLAELLKKFGTRNANNSPKDVVDSDASEVMIENDNYSIYGNLPDDEKVKRNGDADSKSDYAYVTMNENKHLNRRSVPNITNMTNEQCIPEDIYNSEYITMDKAHKAKKRSLSVTRHYVPMTGRKKSISEAIYTDSEYFSMGKGVATKRLSLGDVKTPRGRCSGVHTKGDKGCIYNSDDYMYTYVLNPNVNKGDQSPFIRKKMRAGDMACFCHEDASKSHDQDVYHSCEEIYVLMGKNQIYNSLSDVSIKDNEETELAEAGDDETDEIPTKLDLADKKFEPFNKPTIASTSSEDSLGSRKRFSSVFKKKIEQAKQLMTDWSS